MTSTTDGSNKPTPPRTEKYIKGIEFPSTKEDLTSKFKSNNARADVLNMLNQIEDKEYDSLVEIAQEVGQIK